MKAPSALPLVLGLALLAATPAPQEAQDSAGFGLRPSRWTLELDVGTRLPGTIYNEFLERRHPSDPIVHITRWKERNNLGIEGRATVRFRPEAGVGLYVSGILGSSATEALFSGADSPPETIDRSWTYKGLDVGLSMKLKDWNQGRGLLEYSLGVVVLSQEIDLSAGHRDPLAVFPEAGVLPTAPLKWTSRTFTNWGLSLSASFRVPLTRGMAFRTTFRDMVVPVNTAELASEEEADIFAISGERAQLSFSPFTAHHLSLSVGIEYTLGWGRARRQVRRRLPSGEREVEVDEAVASAMRLAAEGDTVAAVAALEHRVSVEPRDAIAWRELALLKAARAEYDPTVRDEVLATLERALNLNPGDTELLRSYGRVRGLVQREGRQPEGAATEPLALSDLAVEFSEPRDLRLAWAVRGLRADEGGAYRYRIRVEAYREDGESVELRAGLDRFTRLDDGSLEMEGTGDELPLTFGASVFLVDPAPGIHTVRVWVTDLTTGQRNQTSRGFEIPEL